MPRSLGRMVREGAACRDRHRHQVMGWEESRRRSWTAKEMIDMTENLQIDEEVPQMVTAESEAIGELRRIVEEQKEVLVKQQAQLKDLNRRLADTETVKYSAPVDSVHDVPRVNPQEAAYLAMLKEMNVHD